MKKIISVFLCIATIMLCLSGCSSKEASIDFIYPFSANVKSYDPQIASTADEYLIIENTFEGLVRVDDDGTIKPGVAESWSISDDGLTYTFRLKKGIKWNIDTELDDEGKRKKDDRLEYMGYDFNPDITAKDFVFALKRAVSPETQCPLFSSLACIENAGAIHSGKMKPEALGVTANDDYTLQIRLSAPDSSFMQTLSTAAAMPCNEEFFTATKGRYGLSTEYTLFNGQFYLSQILETSYLLKKNTLYTGPSPAAAKELTLKIDDGSNSEDKIDKLKSGYYDAAFISGSDTAKLKDAKNITYTPYNDTAWAFLINTNNEVFQSKTMRKAFCLGLARLDDTGAEYLSNATNLTTSSCYIGSNNAVAAMGRTTASQDTAMSMALWKKGLKIVDKNDIEVTIITTAEMQDYVKKLLQGIQSGIGTIIKNDDDEKVNFTVKIETVEDAELKSAVSKMEYDIAFYPLKSTSSSAVAYLKNIADKNYTGINTSKAESNLQKAESADDIKTISTYTKAAEKNLLDTYSIIPMLYETSYYAAAEGVSAVQFHPGTGRVSFVNADRKE